MIEAEYITLPLWVPFIVCIGILIFSLFITVLVCRLYDSYWKDKACEVMNILKKQYDEECKEYKEMAKEYPTLKTRAEGQRQTIKYYQGLLSWCTDIESKKKIDEFVRKQTEDESFNTDNNV